MVVPATADIALALPSILSVLFAALVVDDYDSSDADHAVEFACF